MIHTLLIGENDQIRQTLYETLAKRKHKVTVVEPATVDIENAIQNDFSLVIVSSVTDQTLGVCRQLRLSKNGSNFALVMVVDHNHPDQLDDILDAGADQCIIESIYDEKRLHIRLAFAEKMASEKVQQQITEQQLRESEARARSILETTVDAIITITPKGNIRTFNKTAEKLFGYHSTEVIGKNVKILMPNPYKAEHDDYMEHYLETGKRKIIGIGREVTGRRKDGSTFPMYLAVSEVKLPDQHIFTGIVRDISEQRRLEQEVLRISEHERQRIGQDLHDGLGQMLTGIGLITKNLARQLEQEEHKLAEDAAEISTLIQQADEQARSLARGLVPVEFDERGLEAALERLKNNAEKLFGIECTLEILGELDFDDVTQAIHLYRIAQEGVSNAVKHGSADKVSIYIASTDQHLRLRVVDNGTGFPENWDSEGGLGVRIMRFRARLIGGSLEISDIPDKGATITCTVPNIKQP
ncbi:PAS domain S-box protein [Rhodohalobacter sp. SW132]|uniref:sensor histidine kinase n=1 Tax=Rhodohalobacter sp. SW132 TaxID=2293433 RepID=UPI000E252805|nr:PAS domain S-box protein [Rhodohalobacter sp. SW132]REL33205.1 PAS domain S-box protein [Rhodohalobacter sp. SW132]